MSTQRVDNLILDSHGHIIVLFFKCMMKQLANGMRKKPMSRHGVFVLLQRNIDSQYYYRMLQSQDKKAVEAEMREKTSSYQNDKLEFIKIL